MPRTMTRGKGQILRDYLPGKTFDFAGAASTIAQVTHIRGNTRNDLNATMLLRKVADQVQSWPAEFRPGLRDEILHDPSHFVFLDPTEVQARLFPRVFWCQAPGCGRILEVGDDRRLPSRCRACGASDLVQLRFVQIHRCGEIKTLEPRPCQKCGKTDQMALDTRGSERVLEFRWVCRRCGIQVHLFGVTCSCKWPVADERRMDIEVHRAGRTYYPHTAVLLNIPRSELDAFFALPDWPVVASAKFLEIPEVTRQNLSSFAPGPPSETSPGDPGLSAADLDAIMDLPPDRIPLELERLRTERRQESMAASPSGIAAALETRTGVARHVWQVAGQELIEAMMPDVSGRPVRLFDETIRTDCIAAARAIGVGSIELVSDFPIVTATYGYSRAGFRPNDCHVRPFPLAPEHGGRVPIYVDKVEADALVLTLDHARLTKWLGRNGLAPSLPTGSDPALAERAYFVEMLYNVPLRQTLKVDQPHARMVFALLHTLSHAAVRQASLLCGLDTTSLSEYLLPTALSVAVYCNHRSGATIGALTALYEQSLAEWLAAIRGARRCVYDPDCREHGASCHFCAHQAENTCRFFNLNLSRSFLFGGPDRELGSIEVGYFDPSLS